MHPIIRNILAVIAGLIVGSIINMLLVMIGGSIIPLPAGVDNSTTENLKESIHLFGPEHYVFPFLAHAIGTLAGAMVTTFIASSKKFYLSLIIGVFFLTGGVYMVTQLPSPLWFNVIDLGFAYIPMAFLGWYLVVSRKNK